MNILMVNLLFSTLIFWIAARLYVLPQLDALRPQTVLLPILLLHAFRHQRREAIPSDHTYRLLLHDRDAIFSQTLDREIRHRGFRVLNTPPHSPQANALCERLLGTLRRECLDLRKSPG